MASMTARPCKHPKTVSRYLRRAMPLDLRMRVGKREEKFSLAIENPGEAKRLHAVTRVELEQRQAALRVVPRRSSEPEAHERAALYDEHRIGLDRDEPRRQFFWRTE